MASLVLTACGGSEGGGSAPAASSDVSAVTAGKIMYGAASDFVISGSNLDLGVSIAASGACSSVSEKPGSTAAQHIYSCTPTTVGAINITVLDSKGNVLKTVAINVPAPQVTLTTSKGTIVVELDPVKAPLTVNNYLTYVNEGFYSNTIYHRVISGFVVQGGGYSTTGSQKVPTHAPVVLEPPSVTGLTNAEGTIAMARTAALNSATTQFFFNTVDNNTSTGNNLDLPAGQGYAVFGKVILGMDVVKLIETTPISSTTPWSDYVAVTSVSQTQ